MIWLVVLAATAIIGSGAFLQGTIGFGMGLFSAPILVLIDSRFVPGPIVAAGMVLTLLMTRREWSAVRRPDLGWSLSGRVAGIVLAVLVLDRISPAETDLLLGGLVLCAVAITAMGLSIHLTRRNLIGAGAVSGFFATISSIGGPPMALLYQRETGPTVRATLSAYFLIGSALTLFALAISGRYGWTEMAYSLALVPGVLVGYYNSRHAIAALKRPLLRRLILVVSAVSASILILRQLI